MRSASTAPFCAWASSSTDSANTGDRRRRLPRPGLRCARAGRGTPGDDRRSGRRCRRPMRCYRRSSAGGSDGAGQPRSRRAPRGFIDRCRGRRSRSGSTRQHRRHRRGIRGSSRCSGATHRVRKLDRRRRPLCRGQRRRCRAAAADRIRRHQGGGRTSVPGAQRPRRLPGLSRVAVRLGLRPRTRARLARRAGGGRALRPRRSSRCRPRLSRADRLDLRRRRGRSAVACARGAADAVRGVQCRWRSAYDARRRSRTCSSVIRACRSSTKRSLCPPAAGRCATTVCRRRWVSRRRRVWKTASTRCWRRGGRDARRSQAIVRLPP